jgi:outer membrane immunogenic protein
MKKLFLAGVAFGALIAGPAMAADLAPRPVYRAAPVAVGCAQFGGWYVGAHAGGAYYDNTWQDQNSWTTLNTAADSLNVREAQLTKSGFVGGVEGGYNWQPHCTLLGIEVDYSWGNLNANRTFTDGDVPADEFLNLSSQMRGFGTVRARTGVVVDNLLLYVTAGLAYTRFDRNWALTSTNTGVPPTFRGTETFAYSTTRWGLVAGVGSEWAINANWSIKGEVLYARFQEDNTTFTGSLFEGSIGAPPPAHTPTSFSFNNQDSVWVTRIGVNYRWGSPGLIVTK